MKKLIISMVIEGNAEDVHEIKGKILATASEAIVSCSIDEFEAPKKRIDAPAFMQSNLGGH